MAVDHKFSKNITDEQIDDVMCTALEGGITYWCGSAKPKDGDYKGAEWGHEVISRGGTLLIYDLEEEKTYELTLKKFLKGLSLYDNHDYDSYDAGDADSVVQLALFGEVVYG